MYLRVFFSHRNCVDSTDNRSVLSLFFIEGQRQTLRNLHEKVWFAIMQAKNKGFKKEVEKGNFVEMFTLKKSDRIILSSRRLNWLLNVLRRTKRTRSWEVSQNAWQTRRRDSQLVNPAAGSRLEMNITKKRTMTSGQDIRVISRSHSASSSPSHFGDYQRAYSDVSDSGFQSSQSSLKDFSVTPSKNFKRTNSIELTPRSFCGGFIDESDSEPDSDELDNFASSFQSKHPALKKILNRKFSILKKTTTPTIDDTDIFLREICLQRHENTHGHNLWTIFHFTPLYFIIHASWFVIFCQWVLLISTHEV